MKKIILCGIILLLSASCSRTEYNIFSTLYGIVSEYDTGYPVSGAVIVLSPSGVTKITGDDGFFEFKELTPQQYTINVQKTGYTTNRKSVNAISGEHTEINITITKQK